MWRAPVTRGTRFALTDQRLKITRGVFNRVTDDMELYRVKDTHFQQTFWQRMVGIGDIVLSTSDTTTHTVVLSDIKDADSVRERVRGLVEQAGTPSMCASWTWGTKRFRAFGPRLERPVPASSA